MTKYSITVLIGKAPNWSQSELHVIDGKINGLHLSIVLFLPD